MLCEFADSLSGLWGGLQCQPVPGAWVDLLAFCLGLLSLAVIALSPRRSRGRAAARALTLVAAGLLLALAARAPEITRDGEAAPVGGLLAVVIDGSQSIWRDPSSAPGEMARLADLATRMTAGLDKAEAAVWQHQVIRFGASASADAPPAPLATLPAVLAAVRVPAPAAASNLAAGLAMALDSIRSAGGGRGAILLIADGNSPLPDAGLLAEARALGVPVLVAAAGSGRPGAGLIAADIGPEQWIGTEATVRLSVLGGGGLTAVADGNRRAEVTLPDTIEIRPARITTAFAARGIRHVTLTLEQDGKPQHRTLFAQVRGPARVLAFGKAAWLEGLDPQRWLVERADPRTPPPPGDHDVVVIDALSPADFAPDYDAALLAEAANTGVFIVNGPLRGSPEQPQRMADWADSALSPILPVDTDPRQFVADPPPRDVVIMVDVSGSMEGDGLVTARAVARQILARLRPKDSAAIVPFAGGALAAFGPRAMDAAGQSAALTFLDRLGAGGGTDPTGAFQTASSMASNYCSFFFLSDGEFPAAAAGPQCYTYFVPIRSGPLEPSVQAMMEQFGDVAAPVAPGRVPGEISFAFLEPEVRDIYWREGSFLPMPTRPDHPMVPPLSVPGLAIAYPRADSAPAPAIHPRDEKDPVMVFRRDAERPDVVTGAFLSEIPAQWGQDPAGRLAVQAMLSEVTGWTDPLRHDIRLSERAGRHELLIRVNGDDAPAAMTASILAADGATRAVDLRPGRDPGSFAGPVQLPLASGRATIGLLLLEEPGRPPQRIPLSLPPGLAARRVQADEPFDWGIATDRLRALAAATGGRMLMGDDFFRPARADAAPAGRPVELWPWLTALASLLLALAFWIGGKRA